MSIKTTLVALAAAFAVMVTFAVSQAGMYRANLAVPKTGASQTLPKTLDVKSQMIDARTSVPCYQTRERNELGVWERRTHCH